jgi:uncharacterized protein
MERVMYNTILAAEPLMPDGRTSFCADFNFDGKKVYKEASWPSCADTVPQIAADYRISTYFRSKQRVVVNLYIPSNAALDSGRLSVHSRTHDKLSLRSCCAICIAHVQRTTFRAAVPHSRLG